MKNQKYQLVIKYHSFYTNKLVSVSYKEFETLKEVAEYIEGYAEQVGENVSYEINPIVKTMKKEG